MIYSPSYHHVLNKINVSTLVLIKDIKDALRQMFGLIAIKVFWNLNEHFPAEAAFWTHFHKAAELIRDLFLTISYFKDKTDLQLNVCNLKVKTCLNHKNIDHSIFLLLTDLFDLSHLYFPSAEFSCGKSSLWCQWFPSSYSCSALLVGWEGHKLLIISYALQIVKNNKYP